MRAFATSSEKWGDGSYEIGKYPVKLYNSRNVLIYQADNGSGNGGKKPSGGVLASWAEASSMSVAVANPITYYGVYLGTVINQSGQSGDLYNYYFASYSRGTDGRMGVWAVSVQHWHNLYLDSYIPLRHKSIYDPCPYGYRIPSNGTYNDYFKTNTWWSYGTYVGGASLDNSWYVATGRVYELNYTGLFNWYHFSVPSGTVHSYMFQITNTGANLTNRDAEIRSNGMSVRCIEECEILTDATEASAGKLKMREILESKTQATNEN